MFYTYVIRSKRDNQYYTGFTSDLRKRFKDHQNNKVFSTKNRGPFKLIYYETCINKEDAISREKYLKTGMGKRYLKNRLKRFLSLTGFTLMEVMIALMILALGLVSIFSLFGSGTHSLYKGVTDVTVTSYANTIFSELSAGLINWSDPPENKYDQIHPSFSPNFKYDLEFTPLDSLNEQVYDAGANAILVTLTIKWYRSRLKQSEKFQAILLK